MATKFKLFFFYNQKKINKPKSLAVSKNNNKVELFWKTEHDTSLPGMSLDLRISKDFRATGRVESAAGVTASGKVVQS